MTDEQERILETLKSTDPDAIRAMTDEEFAEFRRRTRIPNYLKEYIADCVRTMQLCAEEEEDISGEDLLFVCHVEGA